MKNAEKGYCRQRIRVLARTALASGLVVPIAAHAQMATTPAPAVGVQEIVVTAQKRQQRLQDVPIAITALTGDALAANRVQNVSDLSGLAPNVTVRPAAGGTAIPAFSSRGLTSYGVVPGSDKEFSIYLDGVYIGSTRASMFDLPDIERVEVLRGPQGTLFGRNSTTGAVSIVTRDPKGKFGLQQEFTMGNQDEFRSRTTVDLPSVGPFSAYVTFLHDEHRGDVKNLGAGTTWDRTGPDTGLGVQTSPKYLGGKNENSVFAAVKFEPSDRFRTVYKFDYTTNHFTPDATSLVALNTASPLTGSLLEALYSSQSSPVPFNTAAKRPDAVNNSFIVDSYQKNYGHSLTSTFDATDHLSIKNIAAYRYSYIDSSSQLDGAGGLVFTPQAVLPAAILAAYSTLPPAQAPGAIPGYAAYYTTQVGKRYVPFGLNNQAIGKQWSDEIQANYSSRLLTLTIGGLYFHQKDQSGAPLGLSNNLAFQLIDNNGRIPLGDDATSFNKATSLAAYAQAEVHVTPKLDLVAGGRITHDKKSGDYIGGGEYVPPAGVAQTDPTYYTAGNFSGVSDFSFKYKKTKPTYSIGANYKPIRDLLAYVKYSTGFVSGGSIGAVSFKPETVKSLEGGVKGEFLDHRLQANLAGFYAKYQNIQSSQGGLNVGHPELGTVIISQGSAKAYGYEAELTAAPLRGLTLNGTLGYTHIKFGAVNPVLLGANYNTYEPTLIPKYTVSLSGQYETRPLFDETTLIVRADANYHTKERAIQPGVVAAIPAFGAIAYIPATWILNTRFTLHNLGPAHLDVAFWTRNLTNDKSPLFPLDLNNIVLASDFQPARTYGMDVSVRF
jgi:iron complex outermembrane receptor protein